MDKGANTTQNIVISIAIILGILIVIVIGYSLYQKAKIAEGQLANKIALDNQTKRSGTNASVSLTGEAKNSSQFSYDGLIQKEKEEEATTTKFEIVNETIPEVVEPEIIPVEEPVAPAPKPVVKPTVVAKPKVYVDEDRPLTAEEIRQIRQLPIENSPSGKLQTTLEEFSNGEYKANY